MATTDKERFDALELNCWDLRCFAIHYEDDGDIGWRVMGHFVSKPQERVISEVYTNNPRSAIDKAIERKGEPL